MNPVLAGNAGYLAFVSAANDLTTNDTARSELAGFLDVFVRDRPRGRTTLVSAVPNGLTGGAGDSVGAEISADGRYVAFESQAGDLTAGDDNGMTDVFVRDVVNGVTSLLSVRADGQSSGSGPSMNAFITPNGRYVAFESSAFDLVSGDTNGITDVFLRDLQENTTFLVSVNASPAGALGGRSEAAGLSTNGQRVLFLSSATNLVTGVTNTTQEVYVRDLASGTTSWCSRDAATLFGHPANQMTSASPVISSDGRFVAFKSWPLLSVSSRAMILRFDLQTGSTDLITTNSSANADGIVLSSGPALSGDGRFVIYETLSTDGSSALFRWDGASQTAALVTQVHTGTAAANGLSTSPVLSGDGRFIAFLSTSTDLVTNAVNGEFQVFVRDMEAGTRLASANPEEYGVSAGVWELPALSADGQVVAFSTISSDLGVPDENREYDIYVRNFGAASLELVSQRDSLNVEIMANGWSAVSPGGISSDGRYVVFESSARDISLDDSNGHQDVFVHDVSGGTNLLISVSTNGGTANAVSLAAVLSGDGGHVAFVSKATDLTRSDTNALDDIYVRNLKTGTTELASTGLDGQAAGINGAEPIALSADGRAVVFASAAKGLVAEDSDSNQDLFWRDLQVGKTVRINQVRLGGSFSVDANARYVAYLDRLGNTLVVWDSNGETNKFAGTSGAPMNGVRLSPDGRLAFYWARVGTSYELHAVDTESASDELIGQSILSRAHPTVACSSDNRWVAYVSSTEPVSPIDTNGMSDIVLVDRSTLERSVISLNRNRTGTAHGESDTVSISLDGRFVTFRSFADDLVSGDDNGTADVFRYDRQLGTLTLLSQTASGKSGNGFSVMPVISADGSTIAFQSAADDLVGGDYNGAVDVFVVIPGTRPGDSDADGLDDDWEQRFFGGLQQQATADPDQDGATNGAEHQAGTDPTDRSSRLWVEDVVGQSGRLILTWNSAPGRSYRIEFKEDLNNPIWTLSPVEPAIFGGKVQFSESLPLAAHRFYRIVVTAAVP